MRLWRSKSKVGFELRLKLNTSTIRSHEIEKLRNFKEVFLIYYKKLSVTDEGQRAVY